jgi:peptide-methionine (S)-S-oxide reductase
MKKIILFVIVFTITITSNAQQNNKQNTMEIATFSNGCFWCTEAIFQQLNGVEKVTSGYTGGTLKNPTYQDVITGKSGHAEAIQIIFDNTIISFQEILEVFFSTHNPTTLNKQGYDVGTQYRSAIFYHSSEQKEIAEKFIYELTKAHVFSNKIVTEVTKFTKFYPAENYHQNYYNNNKNQGYCRAVINPKLDKFMEKYKSKLKKQ